MGRLLFAGGGGWKNNNRKCRLFWLSSAVRHHRSLALLASGFLIGFLLHSILFGDQDGWADTTTTMTTYHEQLFIPGGNDVQNAERWERRIVGSGGSGDSAGDSSSNDQQQQQSIKLNRARFAAAELGIRRRILLLPLIRSPVGLALHRWVLSAHFDPASICAVVDTSLVDPAIFGTNAAVVHLRPGGIVPTHVQLLNAIANQSLQHNFDWFLLFPERTFVNPFQLRRAIDAMRWNVPLALGHKHRSGGGAVSDDNYGTGGGGDGNLCVAEGGILLSNSAMRLLVEGRNLCRAIVARSEEYALEKCILLTTNLSCHSVAQGVRHFWWKVPEEDQRMPNPQPLPLHDQISRVATLSRNFNRSLTVSPLLSDRDVRALLEHFLSVEVARLDTDIGTLETALSTQFDDAELGWPIGTFVGAAGHHHQTVPNRFQAPVWEMFDNAGNLFGNDPDNNVEVDHRRRLGDELQLVVEMAKRKAEEQGGHGTNLVGGGAVFKVGKLRQGYRRFDPEKGMEYLVDLEEADREHDEEKGTEEDDHRPQRRRLVRVQLARPFHSTTLLDTVPFVKEDSDITIVVPVESVDQALSLRAMLRRQLLLCSVAAAASSRRSSGGTRRGGGDSSDTAAATHRQIRFIVTARSIEAALVRILGANLAEMERKCKHSFNTDSALLLLQPVVADDPSLITTNNNKMPIEIVAIDTAIDRYGQQTLFLLLSPFADFQRDFLDRVRVNTIRHFQVFFPIPFAEFNPFVSGLPPANWSPDDIADFVIHKDRGRFDTDEFGIAALHGTDYATIRAKFNAENGQAPPIDLFHLFHASSDRNHLHLMRPIDPSVRIRYHPRRVCPAQQQQQQNPSVPNCERARAERMGTRAQLARLVFANN